MLFHSNRRRSSLKRFSIGRFLLRLLLIFSLLSVVLMLWLRFFNPPTSSFIELNRRANNTNIQHQWVDIDQVSQYFSVAVIAAEDQRFPHHYGFDLEQIFLVANDPKKPFARGASTLSQQTIKILLLWPERSIVRKIIEAWFTVWLELIVPKKRILELYINFAQFGKNIFGIAAASQYYFSIPATELNPQQSALIAACLPTPSLSNPAKPSASLQNRANIIADQMPRVGGRRIIRNL